MMHTSFQRVVGFIEFKQTMLCRSNVSPEGFFVSCSFFLADCKRLNMFASWATRRASLPVDPTKIFKLLDVEDKTMSRNITAQAASAYSDDQTVHSGMSDAERDAFSIGVPASPASKLEDLTSILLGLPVERFIIEFFSAASGGKRTLIESSSDLSMDQIYELKLRDLLRSVFSLKHNFVEERVSSSETHLLAYFRKRGLLAHSCLFQAWSARCYCPCCLNLPSILCMLGPSSSVSVAIVTHGGSDVVRRLLGICIVVDKDFNHTSLYVHLYDDSSNIVSISNSPDKCILLASSDPELQKQCFTMYQYTEDGPVYFQRDNDKVLHSCSFTFPTCLLEIATLIPSYVEATNSLPHHQFFNGITNLRDEALWWSCPEQFVLTLQGSTQLVPLDFQLVNSFHKTSEGFRLPAGFRLQYAIIKDSTIKPISGCIYDGAEGLQ